MTRSERLRRGLVRYLESIDALHEPYVRDAFLRVPRETFIPDVAAREGLEAVYSDRAFTTVTDARGVGVSSSSQPAIMALMLELLDLEPGLRVLEVGAGTGYNAALLKTIVGRRGRVVSIDIDPKIARRARTALRETGASVRALAGDGRRRLPHGPYDRLIVTASSPDAPRARHQSLRPGGIIVLPIRLTATMYFPQIVVAMRKVPGGFEHVRAVIGGFMGLRAAAGDASIAFGDLTVSESVDGATRTDSVGGRSIDRMSRPSRRRLLTLLAGEPTKSSVQGAKDDRGRGLLLYATLAAPLSRIVQTGFWGVGIAHPRGDSLALLREGKTVRLDSYGSAWASDQVERLIERWRAADRPAWHDLRIGVSYGTNAKAWRTSKRDGCVLTFDWAT